MSNSPCSHKIVHLSQALYRNVNKKCGMRRMSFQMMVAHRCSVDHCVDSLSSQFLQTDVKMSDVHPCGLLHT